MKDKQFITILVLSLIISSFASKNNRHLLQASDDIINTSFDDEDISSFLPRGDVSLTVETTGGKTGKNFLLVSNRVDSWNGVQISLDNICEEGSEYIISVQVKASAKVALSMQYTDSSGTDHYNNLKFVENPGNWGAIKDYKFSMPLGVTGVLIYFESDPGVDISIDDFVLKKAPELEIESDIPSLKDVFKDHFKFGTAVTVSEVTPKTTQKLILKHFNSITIGNELKPDALLDQKATIALAQETGDYTTPVVNLGTASIILDFCQKNNIAVRGHTLVWHSQTPTWFFKEKWDGSGDWVDSDTMLKRMENYIKAVFDTVSKSYPTINFYAWDVVNEAWEDDGKPRKPGSSEESYSNSPWVKIFGDNSFIKYAFQFAKKYVMKGCKLYYNDYNEYISGKTKAIVKMVKELNADEKLIDGIGMQSHLDVKYPSPSDYETAIKAFAELDVDLQVTELDATVSGNSANDFKTQAKYYADILKILVKYSDKFSAVVVWGTLDSTSWRASQYPLLFNGDYTSKEAFKSIVEVAK